jgi:opacity protein-like surface antigen
MLRAFTRSALAASALLAAASGMAAAADLDGDYLRGDVSIASGSPWDGTYIGVSVGYNTMDAAAAGGSRGDVEDILRGTSTLVNLNAASYVDGFAGRDSKIGFGGIVGHNVTWDGVVFGVEGSYQRTNLSIQGDETTLHIYRDTGTVTAGGQSVYENFQARYGGRTEVNDIALLKGRIGYDAGAFMPFVGVGLAIVRGDASRYTYVGSGDTFGAPDVALPATPQVNVNNTGIFGFGMVGSVGVDYMISEGFFVRGEYEMMRISGFDGSPLDIQNFKTSLAAKF